MDKIIEESKKEYIKIFDEKIKEKDNEIKKLNETIEKLKSEYEKVLIKIQNKNQIKSQIEKSLEFEYIDELFIEGYERPNYEMQFTNIIELLGEIKPDNEIVYMDSLFIKK